ncbi:hypothetical protein GB937_010375 [Aspergillus fischeri]|nr:hypothetical protein GB937_010375 [Aspergillus fischeri]
MSQSMFEAAAYATGYCSVVQLTIADPSGALECADKLLFRLVCLSPTFYRPPASLKLISTDCLLADPRFHRPISPTVQQHSMNSHTQAKAPTGIQFPGFGFGTVAQKPATKKIVISQDTQAFV